MGSTCTMPHSSNAYKNKYTNIYAQLQRRADKIAVMQEAERQVEWYSLVIKYRNLTTREALAYYDSLMLVSSLLAPTQQARMQLEAFGMVMSETSIRKASNWGNTKRDTIKQLTWQLDIQEDGDSYVARCPCCQRYVAPTRATWFIKPYYIASGFIKVCRGCSDMHEYEIYPIKSRVVHCISVYHPQYMQCMNEHDVIIAEKVFKEYVTRGIVYDGNIVSWQEEADTYMAYVISKLDSSMNRKKK